MSDLDTAWSNLSQHADRLRDVHLRDLFARDPGRFDALSFCAAGLLADFSKEKLDAHAVGALLDLARAADVQSRGAALFSGVHVNTTEDRPALHMALRAAPSDPWARAEVQAERTRMLDFAEAVRAGHTTAADGAHYSDVLCLGTGGSALGPEMAAKALAPWHDGPRLHFVSNVDGAHLADILKPLDPARTLVAVASKSFTTLETMTNAETARAWLGALAPAQMVALTAETERAEAYGIPPERVFAAWDWVGGRYSVWSSIGLPLALAIGAGPFQDFLDGAAEMDRHFQEAAPERNLPMLLALVGIWRRNGLGYLALAVVPYAQRLARLPAYLQQLEMESNGKRVGTDGTEARQATTPVLFGEPGTNAQHSFFQLLHQGTEIVPVDFILPASPVDADPAQHQMLAASALAQSSALAFGEENADPNRSFPGDRPSTTILIERLAPRALGALLALYEHKVFVQGVIWGINSFDQFGVELGKRLTGEVLPLLRGEGGTADGSTVGLVKAIRSTEP